jgi:hypothetical protein
MVVVKPCIIEDCEEKAMYNYYEEEKGLYCKDHKLSKMINMNDKKRMCIKCHGTRAGFNYEGEKKPLFCKPCGDDDMVSFHNNSKKCIKCKKTTANFNHEGEEKALYCKKCGDDDMVNVNEKRKCIKCNKNASFNYNYGEKPLYCGTCKDPIMVNVTSINKKCIKCKKTTASFNYYYGEKALYCGTCKDPIMVNINTKYKNCIICNKTAASFNYKHEEKALYCGTCGTDDMVDKTHKNEMCIIDGCETRANFNHKDEQKPMYCREHMDPLTMDDKNHKSETCITCGKRASFNYEHEEKPLYCSKHILDKKMVDIVNKRCSVDTCTTHVYYGFPGFSPTRCAEHKQIGQMVCPKSICKTRNCKEIAVYALTSKRAVHCERHMENGEINIIEKRCNKCTLTQIVNEEGLCTHCDPNHFNGFRLAKQLLVKKHIDEDGDYKYIYDKAVNYVECKDRERPDFFFEAYNGCCQIILEVDEDMHNRRPEECERTRMINISQANGMPTFFIRYNPDPYKVKGNKKELSHKTRMVVLDKVLKEALSLNPENLVGYCCVTYLYFNDFDKRNISWKIITPFSS